jgi:hypothetical protein
MLPWQSYWQNMLAASAAACVATWVQLLMVCRQPDVLGAQRGGHLIAPVFKIEGSMQHAS